jgi:hypothetical protein
MGAPSFSTPPRFKPRNPDIHPLYSC